MNQQEDIIDLINTDTTQLRAEIRFEEQLKELINTYSVENDSNTPDFILAQYILNCLMAFRIAVNDRDRHSFTPQDIIIKKEV